MFAQVNADLKATSFAPDFEERRTMQSETLSALFRTYFRILKHAMEPDITRYASILEKYQFVLSLFLNMTAAGIL